MKSFVVSSSLVVAAVLVLSDGAVTRAAAQEAAVKPAPAPTLSHGSSEVLKLVRAKVGDDTVVAYIDHASVAYALSASDLIYLRSEGVSDKVLSAMLTRSKGTEAVVAAPVAPVAPAQPAPPAAPTSYVGANPQPAQTVVQPAQVVVQPAVTTYVQAPPQVVVAPPVVYGYGYYPYYGYRYPALSLSFGFGGGYRGGYRGGFHGGFHGHR